MTASDDCKLGLALSGGGFRSALFHLGVLARLAELDLLRKIDVVSSVSGGSIIAAYYYLKVKSLLENIPEKDQGPPGKDAFIRMVAEIEKAFLAAVQKNMRTRTFSDPNKNARMMSSDYSNTERLAELLTTFFYLPVYRQNVPNTNASHIRLRDIAIQPHPGNLLPDTRVPFLIINATSLNTGHLWQFTSEGFGEQKTLEDLGHGDIAYLKKFRFDDERLTIEQRKIIYNMSFGQAVAASCSVPGIFEPLLIKHLYGSGKNAMNIRLADGGLLDNQGLSSLFLENCTHIICSDASDILKLDANPSDQFLNVALRANDILIDRIRSKSLKELFAYGKSRFALFDLGAMESRPHIFPKHSEALVRSLTRIRTDLDSFTDTEADALMFYGYRLSGWVMDANPFELTRDRSSEYERWRFLRILKHYFETPGSAPELLLHLDVGAHQMFKVFLLKKPLPYLIALPLPVLLILSILYILARTSPMTFTLLLLLAAFLLIHTQNQKILELMDNVRLLRSIKYRILKTVITLRMPEPLSYIMAGISWVQLKVFDRLFLKFGRIR